MKHNYNRKSDLYYYYAIYIKFSKIVFFVVQSYLVSFEVSTFQSIKNFVLNKV